MLKLKERNKAIVYIISAAFFFALMSVFIRLSGDLPFVQKSFFRNAVALVFAFAVLKKNKVPIKFKKENRLFLFLRAFCGTAGLVCNFYAIDHLVLADASMLNKLSPFFAIIFSAVFIREKPTKLQLIAVFIAFAGSLFILRPSGQNMQFFPALMGFFGGMGAGAAYTAVRYLGKKGENGGIIVFAFSLFSCVALLPWIAFNFVPMSLYQLGMLLCAGFAAAGGQFSITAAYSHASAGEISVYDYSQVIFSALLGYAVFGQEPDIYSVVGYCVIISMAVVMYISRDRQNSNPIK